MAEKYIKNFTKGLFSRLENESIPDGAASDSNNWMSMGDHIELRRGQTLLGLDNPGVGKISGLIVGDRFDGTQVPFQCVERKIKYYDTTTEDWIEVSTTNILPVAASGEDFCFDQYHSLAGAFIYGSSKNSGIYKVPIANPASAIDLSSTSHRGKFRIKQNRMFLWDRKDTNGGFDTTGLYGSYIDKDELSDYTLVLNEDIGTGNGVLTSFSDTLEAKATFPKRTFHYVRVGAPKQASTVITAINQADGATITSASHGLVVGDNVVISDVVGMTQINKVIALVTVITDANNFRVNINTSAYTAYSSGGKVAKCELFNDTRNGTLVGADGGTGTINYATGAISVTTNAAVPNTLFVVTDYYWEDSTSTGIADFSKSVPRTAGQGFTFRQDDGGADLQNLFTLGGHEYSMHQRKTWDVVLSVDDTDATNLIYRSNVGIPYWRAGVETGDGIYYADAPDSSEPYIRVLKPNQLNTEVEPEAISNQIDLTGYRFDYCVMKEWGNYIAVACRTKDSTTNDTLFLYNKLWKLWDKFDYRVSCMEIYNGALIAGDSASKNVFTLFSGLTDEDIEIPNYWISGKMTFNEGTSISNLFEISGLIQDDQEFDVYLSYDNGAFVKVQTLTGQGDYVDHTQRVNVGANTLGSKEVGGGGSGIEASPFWKEFRINTPRFGKIRVKFSATKIGYLSISQFGFKDIRPKGRYIPSQYVVNG